MPSETTSVGVTTREYVRLGDTPVAVIDVVNTASPMNYFVHTDHLIEDPADQRQMRGVLSLERRGLSASHALPERNFWEAASRLVCD